MRTYANQAKSTSVHLEEDAERVPVKYVRSDTVGLVVSLLGEPLLLIGVDDGLAGPEICFLGADFFSLVYDFVAEDNDEVKRDALGNVSVEFFFFVFFLTRG
jgi:hypothetical protein